MGNDKLKGEDLAVANGAMSVYAGTGVLIGPFIETAILNLFGARGNFLAVALINIVVTFFMFMKAPETLPVEEQKPLTVKDCSPFTFLGMLKAGSVNQRLMLILLLQSFGEGRVNQDINIQNLRDNLKWTPGEISTYFSLLGAS